MTPQFPETYLRDFTNDFGACEGSDNFTRVVETFHPIAGQYQITLTQLPNPAFQTLVALDSILLYLNETYVINGQIISFAPGFLQVGDTVVVVYWIAR